MFIIDKGTSVAAHSHLAVRFKMFSIDKGTLVAAHSHLIEARQQLHTVT